MSSYNLSRYFMTAPQGQRKTLQKKVCLGYDGAVRKWRMITFVIGLLKSSNVCSAQWSKVKTNIILHFWKLNFLKRVEIVGKNRPKGIVESKINQKKVTGKVKKGPKRTFKSVKILSNMIHADLKQRPKQKIKNIAQNSLELFHRLRPMCNELS